MVEAGMTFNNGLTVAQQDEIDDLRIEVSRIKDRISALGRHRNYSLAITKLDEASLWLANRAHQPENPS